MKSEFQDKIDSFKHELMELMESRENKRRLQYWNEDINGQPYDGWRLIPQKTAGDVLPFVVEFEPTCLAKIGGYDLHRYYHDPDYYLLHYLQNAIYRFKNFKDCIPLRRQVVVFLGSSLEKSIVMGDASVETDDWSVCDFCLQDREDIKKLRQADYFKSRIMKNVKRFYERLVDLAGSDLIISFPSWARSSWGLAWQLRGPEELLIDVCDDPEWLTEFMRFLNEARKDWEKSRIEYCGSQFELGSIYNDEVASPMISPVTYEQLIRPFEIELSHFYGGIRYWHSCGNTTPYQSLIDDIPNVQMVHVSPWTDYKYAAVNYSSGEKALEVALYGYEHVVKDQDASQIEEKLNDIKSAVKGHRAQVRAAGIEIVTTVEKDLSNVKKWIDCANQILL